jgi:HK97 family phage portal protein
MAEIKTILNVPWDPEGDYVTRRTNLGTTDVVYANVPLVYRALNLRCDALRRVPLYIYKGSGNLEKEYPYEKMLPIKDWLWFAEASELLMGASYTLRLANIYGFEKGLTPLNPFTVKSETKNGKIGFYQDIEGQRYPQNRMWTEEEVIYWRSFSPLDDVGPGTSAAGVGLGNAQLLHYLTRFLSQYFEKGAMPVTIAMLPAGAGDAQVKEAQSFFKRAMEGVRKAFKVLAVKGEIKFEKLTPDLATFEVQKLDTHAIDNIAWAFNIPKTLLTANSANRSTAESEYGNFLAQTIASRCDVYQARFNKFLADFGLRCEFAIEELPEMQADEASRSTSLKSLVDAGMPLKVAMYTLGYSLNEEMQALLDKELEKPEPTPVIAAQPEPMQEEMAKWYRKSLKSFKNKAHAQVEFESDVIPSDVHDMIFNKLVAVTTENELKAVFGLV